MNVSCPACSTTYRIDPRRVPEGGIRARCIRCPGEFDVGNGAGATAIGSGAPDVITEERPSSISESPGDVLVGANTDESPAGEAGVPVQTDDGAVALDDGDGEMELPPPPFGSSDPNARARRLARVLVSDIAVYHPDRRERSLREGTIRQEFREEIRKSWDEYVSQVGNDIARETSYFQEALNEILAGGSRLF